MHFRECVKHFVQGNGNRLFGGKCLGCCIKFRLITMRFFIFHSETVVESIGRAYNN